MDTEPINPSVERGLNAKELVLPQFSTYDGLLINVPVDFQQGPVADGEEPPFGLGRIAVVANDYFGLQVGILDVHRIRESGQRLTVERLREILTEVKGKVSGGFVVGMNPTNVNVEAGIEIANILDELKIPYVVGGYFATLSDAAEVWKQFPNALGYIPRQGEVAFSSVVACRVDGKDTASIAGFYTRDQLDHPRKPFGRKISPKQAPPLDQLKYFWEPFTGLNKDGRVHKEASTYLTDGCPFECGFCSSPYMRERQYERPTMTQVVDEVGRLIGQGAEAIHFLDDLVFIKEEDIAEFYDELKQKGLLGKFIWRGMGRANLIDRWSDETMQKLKESGCWQLAIGVESGAPRVLDLIKKKIDPEMVVRATEKNTRFGIGTKGFIIFGFPTETANEMQATYDLALAMAGVGATSLAAFEFHPYPGTMLYQWLLEHNPQVLTQLAYLTTNQTEIGKDNVVGLGTKAKMSKTGMWLPEEVRISELPSREVREWVGRTIEDFYKAVEARGAHAQASISGS